MGVVSVSQMGGARLPSLTPTEKSGLPAGNHPKPLLAGSATGFSDFSVFSGQAKGMASLTPTRTLL
jgi:hypothetical protein